MEKTYHILKVYDYKGGELSTNLNLSYEDFIEELVETLRLYNYVYDQDYDSDEDRDAREPQVLKDALVSGELRDWLNEYMSIYAGGDGICISLYECENNIMTEIELSDEMLAGAVECYLTRL